MASEPRGDEVPTFPEICSVGLQQKNVVGIVMLRQRNAVLHLLSTQPVHQAMEPE